MFVCSCCTRDCCYLRKRFVHFCFTTFGWFQNFRRGGRSESRSYVDDSGDYASIRREDTQSASRSRLLLCLFHALCRRVRHPITRRFRLSSQHPTSITLETCLPEVRHRGVFTWRPAAVGFISDEGTCFIEHDEKLPCISETHCIDKVMTKMAGKPRLIDWLIDHSFTAR